MKPLNIFLGTVLFLCGTGLAAKKLAEIHGGGGILLPPPPATAAKPVTETLHGVTIRDPYRWLEDSKSPETRAWIEAQMRYTEGYLSQVKLRPQIANRLGELERLDSYTVPHEREGKFFFTKRLAEENQASIYMRMGLHGNDECLVDASKLSADQNTSVTIDDVSKDGQLLAYGIREGGADEESVHFLQVSQHQQLPEVLPKARYNVSLAPDKSGLYYAKLEPSGTILYYHRFGTPIESDSLVFGKKFKDETLGPMDWIGAHVTENDRYLLILVGHGVPAKRMDIYAKDLRTPGAPILEMIHGIGNRFEPENYDDDLYVKTDYEADNYRVIKLNMNKPSPENWKTVVPESKDAISEMSIVGGKLFVTGLHDVVTQTRIYSLDGKLLGQLSYPALGSGSTMYGRNSSHHGFYTFESFNIPPTIYHYDIETGATEIFAKPKVPFSPDEYEVKQVFVTSKDGTKVPMFISSKKGGKQDGTAPLLMFAYGGFNISLTPHWNPEYAWWMEQGGYYAQPNLRGGGEYGEVWHKAGMFEKKQNVFDDLFAAAEYVIANKYTSTSLFAIRGRSNGGLLMGAAMTERPDLFGAIWCGYPLLDMLRYQSFLIGSWWTTEYGSSENADQFRYLVKYSPYHNVRPGTKYPAIMFNTGDSDTRVDPLHARKMTALMQASNGGDRPILLHYETQAGHSSGVSIQQQVNDTADELAFLWNETAGRK
jgi:prolyl oligopeptidase